MTAGQPASRAVDPTASGCAVILVAFGLVAVLVSLSHLIDAYTVRVAADCPTVEVAP